MRSRGQGDQTEDWYDICSMHVNYDENCSMCQTGRWINRAEAEKDRELFRRNPCLWREIHNRPDDPGRLFLESVFPNLRKG